MKNIKNVLATRRSNRGLFLKLSVFALFAIMSLFSGQTLAQIPTPTPGTHFCVPTTTLSESAIFPGGGGVVSFMVGTAANAVTIQHIPPGTGLRTLTLLPLAPVIGTTVPMIMIPVIPAGGTFAQVVVTFTPTVPGAPVEFTLRAASLFHDVDIRVRCGATCTPSATLSESPVLPATNSGSFNAIPGPGFVDVDHVDLPTGLQVLQLLPGGMNATVQPFVFAPGQITPSRVFFSVPNPTMAVDFTLRAASTFHDVEIRVRCPAPPTAEPEDDKDSK